ncbi:circularly permuted type 2 ATP-grasp protein [Pseudofrankia inefficax]|uniref:circularly permuted type 2 ATP-grasp protein n=1 Tax=Pseudofrankia inefficax (strain DSM 45817 / CECT 9037 / DDB 130130 / EuI1c) TaxID=298654 RepID=UPI0003220248|nr:circularly permuted type 2 ATP-grasp protein [Pseudofrankia inefficax]
MADLFEGYPAEVQATAAWDEVFDPAGVPREVYAALYDALQPLSSGDLAARKAALDRAFRDAGITFILFGEERPFPLDLVPRLLSGSEWDTIERGVVQRVRALEAFLADIYGRAEILDDGIVPRRLVMSSSHFHRAAHGIDPPNGVRCHVSGIDLIRDEQGRFRVLEDNVRVPSGVSYVIENRRAMTRVFPELFATHRVRPVADYASHLLHALRAAAPPEVADPTVVVLTPGIYNSAYFEHALLARQMGVELVEGRDLQVRDNQVTMRTTEGEQPVHVIYRRIDDDWLDPLHFRPESVVGCAGLINAARAGEVTIANGVGNGVADDKLMYTYVPDLIRYYLGEEPVLPNVDTYRVEDPDQRAYVLDHLDELVVKPVDGSGGKGIVIGPQATDEELATLRGQVTADPRGWIAQRLVRLSTSPTLSGDRLGPRHIDLRPFAVNDGSRIWVLPGGLTRVALPRGSFVVNSSQGGGSKDTWVLAPQLADGERPTSYGRPANGEFLVAQGPDVGPDTSGEQQQQQQQNQQQQKPPPPPRRGGAPRGGPSHERSEVGRAAARSPQRPFAEEDTARRSLGSEASEGPERRARTERTKKC